MFTRNNREQGNDDLEESENEVEKYPYRGIGRRRRRYVQGDGALSTRLRPTPEAAAIVGHKCKTNSTAVGGGRYVQRNGFWERTEEDGSSRGEREEGKTIFVNEQTPHVSKCGAMDARSRRNARDNGGRYVQLRAPESRAETHRGHREEVVELRSFEED